MSNSKAVKWTGKRSESNITTAKEMRHEITERVGSKLADENKVNDHLHKKGGDGSVDALCHYSDGRRDALISVLEIIANI